MNKRSAFVFVHWKKLFETRLNGIVAGHEAAKTIFNFAGQVGAIHSAIDVGEDIRIPPDTMKTLRDALRILEKDMQRKEEL